MGIARIFAFLCLLVFYHLGIFITKRENLPLLAPEGRWGEEGEREERKQDVFVLISAGGEPGAEGCLFYQPCRVLDRGDNLLIWFLYDAEGVPNAQLLVGGWLEGS